MTAPTPLCPNPVQVHDIVQETPDVWTLRLMTDSYYPYEPGQYALVSIRNSDSELRAYTISSSPGLSPFLTLTVRRIANGLGSQWLTRDVKIGDTLWLSDAQGEFTCTHPNAVAQRYLLLAGGCGVTPVMSMTRWLLARRPETDLNVFYNVRSPADVVFAQEWKTLVTQYPARLHLTLMAENDIRDGFLPGRLSLGLLKNAVPDITARTVMTCGPAVYMELVEQWSKELGVPPERFHKEQFHTAAECVPVDAPSVTITLKSQKREIRVPAGTSLLQAFEQHGIAATAACRSGVCGACKTHVLSGKTTSTSQATLTADEIAQGYVLACSCRVEEDIVVA